MRAFVTITLFLLGAVMPAMCLTADDASASSTATVSVARHSLKDEYRRGWHFHDDPDVEVVEAPPPTQAAPRRREKPAEKRAPELVEFERLQKQLVDARNIAIMNPTDTNVRRYMELEARVVRQASYFSEVAQRVAWATPELDMTLQGRPVNARAIEVFDREQSISRGQAVAALSRTHVLFFFFRSDCQYCHAFAPILEAFQGRYGIQIVPISIDGGGLPSFPQYRRDNGIARTLQVAQVPALYLAEPFTGKITPIGFGVLSESQLLERITTISAPGADGVAPSVSRRVSLR